MMENQIFSTEPTQQQGNLGQIVTSESQVDLHESRTDPMLAALNDLRMNNQLTDAVVSCSEGSFPVHRTMLSASSTYFRAQFTGFNVNNDAPSTEPQEIYIPGMSYEVLKELISYAYVKKCNITKEGVFEMLVSADYLGMAGLINECTKFLEEMLTPANCISILKFAKFRFLDALQISSRRYLACNIHEVFQSSRDIMELKAEEFYEIMADDHLNVPIEDDVWRFVLRWINYDPENRKQHIAHLLNAVRTGLMTPLCFLDDLSKHSYVCACPETSELIGNTFCFLVELDSIHPYYNNRDIVTPHFAIPRIPHEVIFAIGGWGGGVPKNTIETYDTRADRWIKIDAVDPAGSRAYHATAVLDQKIYVVGGYNGTEYFSTCRVFDAVSKAWKEIAPMHFRRCYVSCTQLNGLIYAIGGFDGQNRLRSVERYNPRTNQWSMVAPMLTPRSDASACTLNGLIYAVGGFNGQECLDTVEYYNPESNTWSRILPMSDRRSGVACVAFHGSVYAVGGFNGTARLATGERFDVQTRRWHPIKAMHHCRSNFGLEVIDDQIFAIGGFNGVSTISHTECYLAENDEWTEAAEMNTARSAVDASKMSNLPNIEDYIFKDRLHIIEDNRMRVLADIIKGTNQRISRGPNPPVDGAENGVVNNIANDNNPNGAV